MVSVMKKFYNMLSSLKLTIVIFIALMIYFMSATLYFSSDKQAWVNVYGTDWFEFIFWILGINLTLTILRYKLYKKPPLILIHLSILVMLIGAGITRHKAFEGILHLRIGQTSSNFLETFRSNPSKEETKPLGFEITLTNFVIEKYLGSNQPKSYDSYIVITDRNKSFYYHIYMNHPIKFKGLRIYQMSYDPDEKGSVLFIRYDPGIYITYFGYLLFSIGSFLLILFPPAQLKETLKKLSKITLMLFLIIHSTQNISNSATIKEWAKKSKKVSELWSRILVQNNGRIESMDTLDKNIVYKLTKKSSLYGMNYNQIITGMLTHPNLFQNIKMIYIGNKQIREKLKIKGRYASFNDFFSLTGFFAYSDEINRALRKPPNQRSREDKEWLKIAERVFIANEVYNASIFKMFPSEFNNSDWLSVQDLQNAYYLNIFKLLIKSISNYDTKKEKELIKIIYTIQKIYSPKLIPSKIKIEAEIIYNRLSIFSKLAILYPIFGLVLIIIGFSSKRIISKLYKPCIFTGISLVLLHSANLILRWYISGHMPWSDAYESIVFIAWSIALVSLVVFKRNISILGAGFFVSGMFMLTARLSDIDPQIINIIPVLKSYWLLFHVAVITVGYGFLAISSVSAIIYIIETKNREQTESISSLSAYIGLLLLSIGTILGAIWANESWGRYWSWDPKETWSLISILAYSTILHLKATKRVSGTFMAFLYIFSFFFILMTYFGVNFYLALGLHSYGKGEASPVWFYAIKAGIAIWFVLVLYTLFTVGINKKSS
ncbi:cytochrome c biogenesis protein CcsA [Hippea alviniae]|uniref:cytochrome c biogenesis protein CcsA n=1 Tax=Hippea alviniae TaxID=1279027 RepID=UPI0003B6C14A|nr:cytochrome c biogenesis protein CcsA [Hippea alviniae]